MTVANLFGKKNTTPHTRPERVGNPKPMPRVNPADARSVDVDVAVVDSSWGVQADQVEPELNPENYQVIDRNGKKVLEKKRSLGRKVKRTVLKTPSRRQDQADRREQDAADLFTKSNGYANAVKGTSGWLQDYNGDGNISWGERFRSALEFIGKLPSTLFSPGALLIATGTGAGVMLMANAATWLYVGSLNMVAPPVTLAAWALLTYMQSKDTIETLGKRGEAAKLVRAAQTPDWLPRFDANANPQVYELLREYQEGFKQPTKKLGNYKFLGLIVFELVILSSAATAFSAGFSLIALGFLFFSAAGFEIFLRMYSTQLKNILSPQGKELVEKIVASMEARAVKIN